MSAPFPENIEDAYPLSPLQEGMLFHSVNSPGSGVYIEQISLTIEQSDFSPEAFKNSWETLIERHGVFRTAFVWRDLEEPLQVVRKKVTLPWRELDLRGETCDSQRSMIAQLMTEDRDTEFGLNKAPLMRMILARNSEERYTWIWTRHHLIADGWSTNHVLSELRQLYRCEITGESATLEAAPKYRNYIAWLKQRDGKRDRQFWQQYLEGFQQYIDLGIENHRSNTHSLGHFEEASCCLSAQESGSLEALCKSLRITPNIAVQAAWSMLLGRYSGSSDVVWGTTVSGRPASLPAVEKTVGLFINTLPLRAKLDWDQSIAGFLQDVQTSQLAVMEHENTSLSEIVKWSECPVGEPLFQSVVVYENYPVEPVEEGENQESATLKLSQIEYKEQSDLPLALIALPGDTLRLILIYDTSVFQQSQIKRMLAQMGCLLSDMPTNPDASLRTLSFLPPEEKEFLFEHCNSTDQEINTDRFIDQLIVEWAKSKPDATAMVCGHNKLSYEDLEHQSRVLLSDLLSSRIGPGDIVGICLPRNIEALVWMLAVLRSGAAYLMLDPEYPTTRLAEMTKQSGASLIVTDAEHEPRFASAICRVLLNTETQSCKAAIDVGQLPSVERQFTDTAYVLFTSGSTGMPKGVIISHQNLLHSTAARSKFYADPPTSFLLLSSFSFDSSVAGIFWTLISGGKLVISRPRQEQTVDSLLSTISTEQVTHTLCLPSLYHSILDHVSATQSQQKLVSLKLVINAGEVMPSGQYLESHRALLPHAKIYNEYGPTEATVWCAAFNATEHESSLPVPIGKPIANTKLYVLNGSGEPAPLGAAGELVIAGKNLSRGYINDDLATQEAFCCSAAIDNGRTVLYHTGDLARYEEDGNLLYLGRADEQIKIRGHRIEPGELETRILAYPNILATAVIPFQDNRQATRLLAFVVAETGDVDLAELRDNLTEQIPEYMVPSDFVGLDQLPVLANGKLDRQALVDLAIKKNASQQRLKKIRPPSNQIQKRIQQIWEQVLGIDTIGIDDSFFDLGGDSILSIRIVSKMLQAGFDVGPNDIFDAPTIEKLSAKAEPARAGPVDLHAASPVEKERAQKGYGDTATAAFPLTATQAAFLFAHLSRGSADPGHMQIQARIDGNLNLSLLKDSFSAVVSRHDALRTAIYWKNKTEPEQVVFSNHDIDIVCDDVQQENTTDAIDLRLEADRKEQLAIDRYPSWRIYLFRLAPNQHLLCWTLHHALVDGWSASIALQEVMKNYQSRLRGSTPFDNEAPQFISYQHWLNQLSKTGDKDYWKRLLTPFNNKRDEVPTLSVPHDQSQRFTSYEFSVEGEKMLPLQHYMQQQQATLAQILQTAWGVCLAAASQADHVAFYSTVSGRAAPLPGIDKMVGQFVNHLPVVISNQLHNNFLNTLGQIKEQSASHRDHEHVPTSDLLEWCKGQIDCQVNTDNGPVGIQSLVMMENFPWSPGHHIDHPNSIVFSSLQRRGQHKTVSQSGISSNFPLTLVGAPQDGSFSVSLHFSTVQFDEQKAKDLMDKMKNLLEALDTDGITACFRELTHSSRSFFNIERPQHRDRPNRNKRRIGDSALEKSIVAIWQEILDQRVDNVHQNFFELGGNSMSAVRVADAVDKLLNIKMPLALLIEHNTVKRLAEALQQDLNEDFQILVPIQPLGNRTPVFGIHAEGNVLFYRDLSLCLGDNQPFFGLQSPELGDGTMHFDSIPRMAARYIKEIKHAKPAGPYILCGMCFGGLIAFEIAQQLVENGDEVAALIVFDSGGPQLKKSASASSTGFLSRFRYSRTAPLIVKVFKHIKTGRLLKLSKSYISTTPIVYKLLKQAKENNAEQTIRDRIRQVRLNQSFLTRQYRANVYPGKVTFLFSEQFKNSEKTQYELSLWSEACGGRLKSFLVSGHHRSILEPPQVYEVAEIVGKILNQPREDPLNG